jgi:hypothetical protein
MQSSVAEKLLPSKRLVFGYAGNKKAGPKGQLR